MKGWLEMNFKENKESGNHLNNDHINQVIIERLHEIERKEDVKILHAIESGSRAWGFASSDSDYDVRFIYVRNTEDYLRLEETKDFINWELNEVLDISGWDLKRALQYFHKSNATLFEWSNSPVVYYTTEEFKKIYVIGQYYFSCKSVLYHYYGTAKKNYRQYLTDEMVKYKKYFYVLRPLLACKWIEERMTPPPVLFDELRAAVLEPELQSVVDDLIARKVKMSEHDKAPRIDVLNQYIIEKLEYYKEFAEKMENDRNHDWGPLNGAFVEILEQ